jgi:IS5 family transposase
MRQTTLATAGFDRYAKTTRRDVFLAEMEAVVPWAEFCSLIDPVYPKAGNGRRPVGLERMLRIYFLQQWIDLSDPGAEESLYDSHAMRRFVGIDLGREPVPDETTICNFRHLLERHDRGNDAASRSRAAPSSTRPSSAHQVQPRMRRPRVIPTCVRPARGLPPFKGGKS